MSKTTLDNFYSLIRQRMEALLQDENYGYTSLEKCPSVIKGKLFLKLYLNEYYSRLNDIDEDDIIDGTVDGSDDLGIDFIHIIENQIYVIQAKYGKSDADEAQIKFFMNIPNKLLKENLHEAKSNKNLKSFVDDIKKIKHPFFNLIFVTTTKLEDELISRCEGNVDPELYSLKIISLSQLKEEHLRIESLDEIPPEKTSIELGGEDFSEFTSLAGDYKTILFTQKGTKIKDLFLQHKETLFNYNIRHWLGKNSVNSAMIDTIVKEPERFFFYNNGVTAVCEEFHLEQNATGKKLICKNLQITNGAQTITTIAKQKDTSKLSRVKLLIRLIQAETGKKTHAPEGLNENLVKFNNSQTTVSVSDFRSNDPVQVSIQKKAKQLKYTFKSPITKEIFYKRKRRKELEKGSKVITLQELGKTFYSYWYNPYELNSEGKRLWDISDSGFYWDVFGSDGKPTDFIDDIKFNYMFMAYYLMAYVKEKIKNYDPDKQPSVYFKYHILWGIKNLLNKKHGPEEMQLIAKKIVEKGEYINPDVDPKKERKLEEYLDKVCKLIDYQINIEKGKEQTFVLRNYLRSRMYFNELDSALDKLIAVKDLPELIEN